jgi:glycosyltransferase involved in cell wall biosynthesis
MVVKLRRAAGTTCGGAPQAPCASLGQVRGTEANMQVHTLVRIDGRPIQEAPDEIRAFMTVRDEMVRLPHNLAHHRKIGVARFFVIDNGSTDGTREFLLAQPDCHVFMTHDSYSESMCGLDWQNALLDEYGLNHWCLTVDADEWFIYPGYETKPLSDLAAYLHRTGAQGVFSFLLDMYGPGPVAEAISQSKRSLLDVCPYFDGQYAWRRRLNIPGLQRPHFPEYNVAGGPRWRWFFPRWHRHYYLLKIMWHISGLLRFSLPVRLREPPMLRKIPFVRRLPGTRYENPHATTRLKLSDVTGILLHFKFLQDFYQRVNIELNRKEHRAHGIWATELARYMEKLKGNPSLSFRYPGSVEYKGSEQLIALGLVREDQGWMQIRTAAGEAEISDRGVAASMTGSRSLDPPSTIMCSTSAQFWAATDSMHPVMNSPPL